MSRTTGDGPSPGIGRLESTWTEVNGLPMHALASVGPVPPPGRGAPPVVLVHGLGLSCRYMVPLARHLAGDFRVFAPDLPGFGDSAKPREVLDVPGLADALAAWVRATGLGRVAPLGNSFGCQVIVDFAARYPELVGRAVLQGPTTPPDERSWLWQFVRWRQNQPYNPPAMGPVTWRDYRKAGLPRLYRTFRHVLRDLVEDKLPCIPAPTLVVRGQLDPICRLPWATEVARLLPDGRLAAIPGVAHTLCYTAPVELAAVSRMFLDEGGGGAARAVPRPPPPALARTPRAQERRSRAAGRRDRAAARPDRRR